MIEDDLYRSSTQFRHWSFTTSQLAEQRKATNEYAAAKVRAAFQRVRAANGNAKSDSTGDNGDDGDDADAIDTLTVEEELKIIEWGSGKIQEMGTALRAPKPLIATAMQYLRRFYLTNSPMTYNPKSIMACAVFVAAKAEHYHLTPHHFTAAFNNLSEDDLKAPEFLLLQGIKFTLDVRHPFLGLDGGWMEMKEMIDDERLLGGVHDAEKRGGSAIQTALGLLRREAQMTDAYFLFTPAQIWMAAVLVADEELLRGYLDIKFDELANESGGIVNNNNNNSNSKNGNVIAEDGDEQQQRQLESLKRKITQTVEKCAEMLKAWKSPEDDKKERKELARIGKKLAKCQDPEKADIVAVARAKRAEKREGSDSEREEKKKKKRKMEQEALKRDGDVFGGELRDVKPATPATANGG